MGWRDWPVSTKWGVVYLLINISCTMFIWIGSIIEDKISPGSELLGLVGFFHFPSVFLLTSRTFSHYILGVILLILVFFIGKLAGYLWNKYWAWRILSIILLLSPFFLFFISLFAYLFINGHFFPNPAG